MNDRGGFYLMHRGWLDHPALSGGPFCARARWVDMIDMAAWRPHRRNINGKLIELQRGEFTASIRFLATRWGVGKGVVERFIARLKTETMIETRTETGQLIITICNYDRFQSSQPDAETTGETHAKTAAGQQQDSSGTKEKEEKQGKQRKQELSLFEGEAPKRRRTRLTADFVMPGPWIEWAQQERPDLNVDTVAQQFINHAHATGRMMVDWKAAWRMWISKEKPNAEYRQSRSGRPGYDAVVAGAAAALGRK